MRVLNQHAEYRGWRLYAINIRTNHVHVVVSANTFPGRMMGEFKAYASRHLREQGLIGKRKRVWVEGGSKKHLFNIKDVEEACEYVIHGQGPDLPVE